MLSADYADYTDWKNDYTVKGLVSWATVSLTPNLCYLRNLRIYFFSGPHKCFRMNVAIFQASMAFQGMEAIV
jgi:hypothetical protein